VVLLEPALHGRAAFQIQLSAADCEQVAVTSPLKRPAERAALNATVAGHEYVDGRPCAMLPINTKHAG
jgi:hypothetical protein